MGGSLNSIGGFFYFMFSFSLGKILYFLIGIGLLLLHWKRPFFKARIPPLVLTTAFGFFIRSFLMVSLLSLLLSQNSTTQAPVTQCIFIMVMLTVVDILVFWPTLLRLYYVFRVTSIIKAFYANSDQQMARIRARKSIICIFIIVGLISLYEVLVLFIIGFVDTFRQGFCHCTLNYNSTFYTGHIVGYLDYIFQIIAFVYFSVKIYRVKISLKYKIKEELLILTLSWAISRLLTLISFVSPDCYLQISNWYYRPQIFIGYIIEAIAFTFLIPFPLWANRHSQQEPNLNQLMLEFPEALYFWIPNYYFNLYLRRKHPQYAKYRPFIADILRFDFQIEEALTRQQSTTTQGSTNLVHPSNSSQMYKKVLDLALYMRDRYLREESQGFCAFSDQPDVLQNIRQKYSNLEENLDEFLFEFVRPYIEACLSPLYAQFIESEEFEEMKKEMSAGEMFEWVLSSRSL